MLFLLLRLRRLAVSRKREFASQLVNVEASPSVRRPVPPSRGAPCHYADYRRPTLLESSQDLRISASRPFLHSACRTYNIRGDVVPRAFNIEYTLSLRSFAALQLAFFTWFVMICIISYIYRFAVCTQ